VVPQYGPGRVPGRVSTRGSWARWSWQGPRTAGRVLAGAVVPQGVMVLKGLGGPGRRVPAGYGPWLWSQGSGPSRVLAGSHKEVPHGSQQAGPGMRPGRLWSWQAMVRLRVPGEVDLAYIPYMVLKTGPKAGTQGRSQQGPGYGPGKARWSLAGSGHGPRKGSLVGREYRVSSRLWSW
jgi:hypothetical protein